MKYNELREQFPNFYFKDYKYEFKEDYLSIIYEFEIENLDTFNTEYKIPISIKKDSYELETLIRYLGIVEAYSVYKLVCAKNFILNFKLNHKEEVFFYKLAHHGLGEYRYLNNIDLDKLFDFVYEKDLKINKSSHNYSMNNRYLLPIGGGKDSLVSAHLLKDLDLTLFALNESKAIKDCMNLLAKPRIITQRKFDQKIIKYNALNYLNGHTPFSALLAFTSVICAYLNGISNIALSNEASANESSVKDSDINHQYSKSFAFEKDFNELIKDLNLNIRYFSFLRPLSELEISGIFAKIKELHKIFKSCNRGSKEGIWCNACAKCLFIYIMLAAYLNTEELYTIFKDNLLDKIDLLNDFKALIGESENKPFECVGTRLEVNLALIKVLKLHNNEFKLLAFYKNSKAYHYYKKIKYQHELNNEHFLNDREFSLIKEYYDLK